MSELVLRRFVESVNRIKGFSIECSPESGRADGDSEITLSYADMSWREAPSIRIDDLEPPNVQPGSLPLAEERLSAISLFFDLLSEKTHFPNDVREALFAYFTCIIFIQDFASSEKRSPSYKAQCDVVIRFLRGEIPADTLSREAAHPSAPPNVPLLVEALADTLIHLKAVLSRMTRRNSCDQEVIDLFYREFENSIRICHLPSIEQRSHLEGYLRQATASSMSKPAFLLLFSTTGLRPQALEGEAEIVELMFLCMRLANDVFSVEREKKEDVGEFRRNIVNIIARSGVSEKVAYAIAIQTYNLALAHYLKRKQETAASARLDLFRFLEVMNDAPVFVWSQLSR